MTTPIPTLNDLWIGIRLLSICLLATLLIGCQSNPRRIHPYTGAQRFTPKNDSAYFNQNQNRRPRQTGSQPSPISRQPKRVGYASFYGEELRDSPMANGEPFDPDRLTAASWFFPFNTQILVTHQNRAVTVTITDRGPALHLVQQGRIIDLSEAAFTALADPRKGLIYVRLYRIQTD